MRSLFVASHKGGVGKTTAALNLAAAGARDGASVLLLDADPVGSLTLALGLDAARAERPLPAPGETLLFRGVLAGLDVLRVSWGDGDDPGSLLERAKAWARAEGYALLVLDAQACVGPGAPPLLRVCEELVLVVRAEPLAYRTLPQMLRKLTELERAGGGPSLAGVLLTLSPGEPLDGRWERGLRLGFGSHILPAAIPHDEAVGLGVLRGLPVIELAPESVAAAQFRAVASSLRLA